MSYLKKRVRIVAQGRQLIDKARLLVWTFLDSTHENRLKGSAFFETFSPSP